MTSNPGFQSQIPANQFVNERVVVDDHMITSIAPGSAIEFALAIIESLLGKEAAAAVAGPLCLK